MFKRNVSLFLPLFRHLLYRCGACGAGDFGLGAEISNKASNLHMICSDTTTTLGQHFDKIGIVFKKSETMRHKTFFRLSGASDILKLSSNIKGRRW